MNVERLETLAKTIQKGYHVFDGKKVAFSMGTHLQELKHGSHSVDPATPNRPDLPRPMSYDMVACMIGFAALLYVAPADLVKFRTGWGGYNLDNLEVEACNILGLDGDVGYNLFYGVVDSNVTGEEAARVIRKLLISGEVDWMMIERELEYY